MQLCHEIIHYDFGRQNWAMLNIIEAKNAKILALSQGDVSKCEFLTGKDVLREKVLLEKAAKVGRLE